MATSSVEARDGAQILRNAWAYLAKQHGHDLEDVHEVISAAMRDVQKEQGLAANKKSGLRAGRRK